MADESRRLAAEVTADNSKSMETLSEEGEDDDLDTDSEEEYRTKDVKDTSFNKLIVQSDKRTLVIV